MGKLPFGCVRAMAIKKGKILLVNESSEGVWETPGCRVETSDKTPQETCKREVLEETGYKCEIGELLDFTFFDTKEGNKIFSAIYAVKLKGKSKKPDEDIASIKWFNKEEIKKLLDEKKCGLA